MARRGSWAAPMLLALVAAGTLSAGAAGPDPLVARFGDLDPETDFAFPVGPPDASGYYDAQPFGTNFHLGEDWNGNGGGDTDRGDPVTSIGRGRVVFAGEGGPGWGKVVRVVHHLRHAGVSSFPESLYAHLDRIDAEVGAELQRGDAIGTIGDGNGAWQAHLHFEIRRRPDLPLGSGYSPDDGEWLDPSAFLRAH